MNEVQMRKAITDMSNSKEYLSLKKYYAEESLFKTLHMSREEKVHSNFIAWLLNPLASHELNYLSLQKFLQMLAVVSEKDINNQSYFPKDLVDKFLLEDISLTDKCEVMAEVPTGTIADFDKKGRIDILIHLCFKDSSKILPIIIENKVLSTENKENDNKKQTQKYLEWGKVRYSDTTKYENPIYVFLAPDYERDIKCACEDFIKLSYQNLVNYFIEPCLLNVVNEQAKYLIENYLRCLNNSTVNSELSFKEKRIMAFTTKEKELLEKFYEKNKDIFDAVLTMLSTDEDLSDADRDKMKAVVKIASSRDYSEYLFDGKKYRKNRLVLAVVNSYVNSNPTISFDDLKKVFPDELQGSNGVVRLLKDVPEKQRKLGDGNKRYFAKPEEIIILSSGEVLVSDQWGLGNIERFIEHVEKTLGYIITKN